MPPQGNFEGLTFEVDFILGTILYDDCSIRVTDCSIRVF